MLFTLFDTAANNQYDLMVLKKHYASHRSLFKGTKDEVLEDSGPWLFEVDDKLRATLDQETGVSCRYMVLLESVEGLEAVFMHLKRFVYQTVGGREYFFRFWDSRVLAKYLPTCEASQIKELFGPIECFVVESDRPGEVIVYAQERGRLRTEKVKMEEVFTISKP